MSEHSKRLEKIREFAVAEAIFVKDSIHISDDQCYRGMDVKPLKDGMIILFNEPDIEFHCFYATTEKSKKEFETILKALLSSANLPTDGIIVRIKKNFDMCP